MRRKANDKPRPSQPAPSRSDTRELRPAPSQRRPTAAKQTQRWSHDLLNLSTALPIDAGEAMVVRLVVERLAQLLPTCAVGACVVQSDNSDVLIETRLPDGSTPDSRDPTRLFPGFRSERVVALDPDLGGSTLHVAGSEAWLDDHDSVEANALERAAMVLSAGVRRARIYQRSRKEGTELQRLQAQVIQNEKLASLGQIVAGVVHELNNPLTSIVAYSDYLGRHARDRGDSEEDIERLRRIGEAAERILKFSRDLVAYARPATEIPAAVDLHEVIDKALVFCEHEFVEAAVVIERRLSKDVPPVRGVGGQLTQVFVNLFTNASHAMLLTGGTLTISTRRSDEGMVLVDVCDEGTGIEPDALGQIFEPFFTTKTDGRGTGLGLSIVRDIVTSHGGTMTAQSNPGVGTTFSLVLPVASIPE